MSLASASVFLTRKTVRQGVVAATVVTTLHFQDGVIHSVNLSHRQLRWIRDGVLRKIANSAAVQPIRGQRLGVRLRRQELTRETMELFEPSGVFPRRSDEMPGKRSLSPALEHRGWEAPP